MENGYMKKVFVILLSLVLTIGLIPVTYSRVMAATNPYPTSQDVDRDGYYEIPCTRFAWQQVYDNLGIALPAWGNAVNWWQSAKNAGYATGNTPRAGAIAVWSGDTYGHVAYVTGGSGNTFTVNEGGRTDLDHTSSHGVKYGYTLTNAVGGRRPYDTGKILLGFIYPAAAPAYNPQGCVDSVVGGNGTVRVAGWAFDRDSVSSTLGIHVYVGGSYAGGGTANLVREDVNKAYPGVGNNHGYDFTIKTSKRGAQKVQVYAINVGGGTNVLIGERTVTINKDTIKPIITNARITDVNRGGYTITVNTTDNIGVTDVKFPTWTDKQGQDDLKWVSGNRNGNEWSYRVKVADHNYELGTYITHIYAYDADGNYATIVRSATIPDVTENQDMDLGEECEVYIRHGISGNYLYPSENTIINNAHWDVLNGTMDKTDENKYIWIFKKQSDGYYTIQNKATGKYMDVAYSSVQAGANLILSDMNTENNQNNQKFKVYKRDNNYYLSAKCTPYTVVDIKYTTPGTSVYMYWYDRFQNHQQLRLELINTKNNSKSNTGGIKKNTKNISANKSTISNKNLITKIKKAKKSLKVTWSEQKNVKGYLLQYATNKKFKKAKKLVVKGGKKTSKTIKKLKARKKYYVRIRTYNVVNGKKVYSSWSKVKIEKTK